MLKKVTLVGMALSAMVLAGCTVDQVPIQLDPVYDKLGAALCTADGAPATSVTAAGARPCRRGEGDCVGSVIVDDGLDRCRPRQDCPYRETALRCPDDSSSGDGSSTTGAREPGRDPST